jgi:hypothetical protein
MVGVFFDGQWPSPDGNDILLFWGSEQKIQRTAGRALKNKKTTHNIALWFRPMIW